MNDLLGGVFPVSFAVIERVGWILLHSIWQLAFVAIVAALFLRIVSHAGRHPVTESWLG